MDLPEKSNSRCVYGRTEGKREYQTSEVHYSSSEIAIGEGRCRLARNDLGELGMAPRAR